MITINVKDISQYAMFEQDGIKLREAILKALQHEEMVILDFEGVDFFTTMYFNASIGWLVLTKGPSYVAEKIKTNNISELGQLTWKHSFENATRIGENEDYKEAVRCFNENEGE